MKAESVLHLKRVNYQIAKVGGIRNLINISSSNSNIIVPVTLNAFSLSKEYISEADIKAYITKEMSNIGFVQKTSCEFDLSVSAIYEQGIILPVGYFAVTIAKGVISVREKVSL